MQSSNIPSKIPLPFGYAAGSGYINPIPTASQIGINNGRASLHDGFPPDTFTPIAAGGVPPFGGDFNGILNEITSITQWQEAGGNWQYDSAFSTAVGGYPKGAILQSSTLAGFWVSTAENNTTNPDTGGANWTPFNFIGSTPISITGGTTALTTLQAAYPIIIISGALTSNAIVNIPAYASEWVIINNTSGAYTLQVKTPSGTGVPIAQGTGQSIYGDGTNIYYATSTGITAPQFDNSGELATTAFVQRALGNFNSSIGITSSSSFTIAQAGAWINYGASGIAGQTLSMPSASGKGGATFGIFNGSPYSITLTSAGGIFSGSTNTSSMPLPSNSSITIVSDNTNWDVVGNVGGFSLGNNGFQILSSGLIMQWGLAYGVPPAPNTGSATYTTVTFPLAFPNYPLSIQVAPQDTYGANDQISTPLIYSNGSPTSFQYGNTDLDTGIGNFRWLAIGY